MNNPLHIISLGAGVQSSTMALMAAAGEITPMPSCAIFADTQDEPASVYKWLDWLEPRLPFPVHRVTAGKLSDRALKMKVTKDGRRFSTTDIPLFTLAHDGTKGKITSRGCTADFKIFPIIRKTRELVAQQLRRFRREQHDRRYACKLLSLGSWAQPEPIVIQWIGISLDEVQRMKPSRDPWIKHRWPLIENEIRRHQCLDWMKARGFPTPPRSACVYCPYHSNAEWRRLRDEEPLQFEKALQGVKNRSQNFDSTPFLHRSCVPLDKVDLSTDIERGQGILAGFNAECEGMCGV